MRVLRTVVGVLVLLVALPLLIGGAVLWSASTHRGPDGAFSAAIDPITTEGYAVVVPDVDAVLRRDAAFVRGGQTALRLTARTDNGPAFVGLAPADAVARYLAGVPHTELTEVKLTRGRLPVRTAPVQGTVAPATPPAQQPFWLAASTAANAVEWTPADVRGKHLTLVVMSPDAATPVRVSMRAAVSAGWLASTMWGMLVLGAVLLIMALAILCWPDRPREIVYVVETPTAAVPVPVIPRPVAGEPPADIPLKPPVELTLEWPVTASGPPATGTRGATLTGGTVFPEGRESR